MVATRFSVALHILLFVAESSGEDATSARMAQSIGTNPVVVRRIAGLLSRAGLLSVQRGPGGASLARPAASITLREVWGAVHPAKDPLIRVHPRTNQADALGRAVPDLLRTRFRQAEAAMLEDLDGTTLAELSDRMRQPAPRRAAGG